MESPDFCHNSVQKAIVSSTVLRLNGLFVMFSMTKWLLGRFTILLAGVEQLAVNVVQLR